MKEERIQLYIPPKKKHVYDELISRKKSLEENGKPYSWCDTIEDLLEENRRLSAFLNDEQTKEIELTKQIEKLLVPVKQSARFADKNTRIILEVLNGMLIDQDLDTIALTSDYLSPALSAAQDKVSGDINSIIKRNLEKKAIREAGIDHVKD